MIRPRDIALRLTAGLVVLALVSVAGPAWPEMVIDEMGREVDAPDQPRRIIGLSPSLTEILFALGLGSRVVGATHWANYPPEASRLPRVGAYISPNLEQIVALNPDLVLANKEGNPPWVVEKLTEAGIPVYVTNPDDPSRLPESLRRLGRLCGAPEAGRVLADELKTQFDRVATRLEGAKMVPTLLVVTSQPLVSAGERSFSGRLLVMAGGLNLAAGALGRWPSLSREYVVVAQPEVVVVSTMAVGQKAERLLEYWQEMPGLKGRAGLRVATIVSDLIDRPGPRLGMGLVSLATIIHPERFPSEGGGP